MEPRARASRHKGQLNFPEEVKHLLHGFGAPSPPSTPPDQVPDPYPETLRLLDEALTDFIIEICHSAVAVATYSGRQKLKVDDFRFVLRKDPVKLGRVQQMYLTGKDINRDRKAFDAIGMGGGGGGGLGGKVGVGALEVFGEMAGEEGTGRGKGRGRGRGRKRKVLDVDGDEGAGGDVEEGATVKKARSEVRSDGS